MTTAVESVIVVVNNRGNARHRKSRDAKIELRMVVETYAPRERAPDGIWRIRFERDEEGFLWWPGAGSRYTDGQLHYTGWTKD